MLWGRKRRMNVGSLCQTWSLGPLNLAALLSDGEALCANQAGLFAPGEGSHEATRPDCPGSTTGGGPVENNLHTS